MTGRRSKRHHFVPKSLQKYFCAHEKSIYYSERDPSGFSNVELRNVNSTFWRRNLNTITISGKPTDWAETQFYSGMDNCLAKLLDDVNNQLKCGFIPIFPEPEGVVTLVYQMLTRSPDFFEPLVADYFRPLGVLPETEDPDVTPRNVRLMAQMEGPSSELRKELGKFVIRWGVAVQGRLILGSRMVYRIGNRGSNGLANPKMEIWFPISPTNVMVLLRDPENRIPALNKLPDTKIRQFNEFVVTSSQAVASHSERLLRSLVKRKRAPLTSPSTPHPPKSSSR